jgi:pimeloyl-ACP methyl ester carboxylesterase
LLLHGLGSRSDDWQLQLPARGALLRCAADMRGHSRTAKPPGPTSVPVVADVLAADALGIDAAHVVGCRWAG